MSSRYAGLEPSESLEPESDDPTDQRRSTLTFLAPPPSEGSTSASLHELKRIAHGGPENSLEDEYTDSISSYVLGYLRRWSAKNLYDFDFCEAVNCEFDDLTVDAWSRVNSESWGEIKRICITHGLWLDHYGVNGKRHDIMHRAVHTKGYKWSMKEINWAESQNYVLSPKVAARKAELQQQSMSQPSSATATGQEAATSSAPQPQSEPRIASPRPASKPRAAPKITRTKFPSNRTPDSPIPPAQNTGFQPRVTSFSTDTGPYDHHSFLPTGFDFNASSPSAKAKQNKAPKTGPNPLFPPSSYQNIKNLDIQPN